MTMTAKESLELMYECLDYHATDIQQLLLNQTSYDNKIDPATWVTDSTIPTAQQFIMVEEALGPALDGLFPDTNGLQLIPNANDVTPEQWQKAEWALWTQLTYAMKLRDKSLKSIKDSFKLGLGYGIVEPFSYNPHERANLIGDGKSTPLMIEGDAKTGIRYRYISTGRIIPYKTGSDFDGDDATPMFWFYDPYPAWELEAMYDGTLPNGIKKDQLKGTFADIKKAAKEYARKNCRFQKMVDMLGGRNTVRVSPRMDEYEPTEIVIIKQFIQPNKWVWIVPDGSGDGKIIYESEQVGQRMSSGLIKWSAHPDGDRWFPMNTAEASRMQGYAHDLWFNFLIDMMGRAKSNVRVINKSALPRGDHEIPDGEDIYVDSSARDAVGYVQIPNIDPQLAGMGQIIDSVGDKIKGNSDFTQKNFTRGGANAFNDLMNTMQARQRLSVTILETGALTKIYERVLAYMQVLVPDTGFDMVRPIYDADSGDRVLDARVVTAEDLNHDFALDLDLSTRRMLGGMSDDMRLRLWQAGKDNPAMRPSEHNRLYPVSEGFQHRLFKGKEEQDRLQEEDRNAAQLAVLSQGAIPQGGQQQVAPATGGEQLQ